MRRIKAITSPEFSEREKRHAALARRAAAEGCVLLQNNGILPLAGGEKIALFGSGARMTLAGGKGSGAMHQRYTVSVESGLEQAGFAVTSKRWLDRYDEYYQNSYAAWKAAAEERASGAKDIFSILGEVDKVPFLYPTGIPVTEEDIASSDTQTAVYVIARQAGEGTDRKDEKGDFRLDDVEYENLRLLSQCFTKFIVIVNVGGLIDLSFLDEIKVGALLFCGQPGMEGGSAVGDLLSGKISPSGKLSCTWAKRYADYPTAGRFSRDGDAKQQDYRESIFVGYRYFDSFGKQPIFPFGFGLSYTKFRVSVTDVRQEEGNIVLAVAVKNIGERTGRETVQAYVTVPGRAENAEFQRLVAFEKTKELSPGEEQKLSLCFAFSDCASYSEERAAFVLGKGKYLLRVGTSSRDTEAVYALLLENEKMTEQCIHVCRRERAFQELISCGSVSAEELPALKIDEGRIKTLFHDYAPVSVPVPPLIREMTEEERISLVVGAGLHASHIIEATGSSGYTTSSLFEKYGIPDIALADGPAGLNLTPELVQLEDGTIKPLQIYPQYDFGAFGQMMRMRLGKAEEGTPHYQYATAWPAEIVLAQTWDRALLREIGAAGAEEMEEFGVSVWLAPGANIYRDPLCGRTFEYFSEDPLLSGEMAAAIIGGVQTDGRTAVSLKHFACNNCEEQREYSSSNVSERALREIYLRSFRIAVEKSAPMTVMASYNLINGVHSTNNEDLLVRVLRNEWGFEGLVMSDWNAAEDEKGGICPAIKAQCDLLMPGKTEWKESLMKGLKEGKITSEELDRSAARVLALVERTHKL